MAEQSATLLAVLSWLREAMAPCYMSLCCILYCTILYCDVLFYMSP